MSMANKIRLLFRPGHAIWHGTLEQMDTTQIGTEIFNPALQTLESSSAGSNFICLSSPSGIFIYINKRVH